MKDYHRGKRLNLYLTEQALRDLDYLPGETKRSKIESAIATALQQGDWLETTLQQLTDNAVSEAQWRKLTKRLQAYATKHNYQA